MNDTKAMPAQNPPRPWLAIATSFSTLDSILSIFALISSKRRS
jgi:hypothetical protein